MNSAEEEGVEAAAAAVVAREYRGFVPSTILEFFRVDLHFKSLCVTTSPLRSKWANR